MKTILSNESFRSFEYLDASFINLRSVRIIVLHRPPISASNGLNVDLFMNEFSTLVEEVVPCSDQV